MTRIAVAFLVLCGLPAVTGLAQDQQRSDFRDPSSPGYTDNGMLDQNAGLHYGPLRISPELSISYTHDSNPTYTEHDAKGVSAIHIQPLLDLTLNGNGWSAYGRGWLTRDWYLGSVDPTYEDTIAKQHYGETVGFNLESPRGNRLSLTEFFEYQNRNNVVTATGPAGVYNASWQDRYSFILGSSFETKLSELTGLNVGASYSDLWYDNPTLYGWQDVGGTIGFSRLLTEKSDLVLDFGYDDQMSDGSSGESRSYRVMAGFGSRPTAKSSYRAEVGVMRYDFSDGSASAVSPTYNFSGDWRLTERLSANVSGSSIYQPSETDQNNYTLVDSLTAGLTFQPTRRLTTSVNLIYRREDYARVDAGEGKKRLDNQVDVYARASYQLFRYTSVFVGADLSKDMSSIDEDSYNRIFLETGVNLRF